MAYDGLDRRIDERTLGEHGARITVVEADVREIKGDVKEILAQMNQARGGWKTVLLVAGVAGTMGAAASKILGLLGLAKP